MTQTALQLDLSIFFIVAVILIWFMIAYQLVLTLAGYFHYLRSMKEKREVDGMKFDFPKVSILIPAHNEEKVIRRTLQAMLAFDYSHGRYEVVVIDDGSTDRTAEIVDELVLRDERLDLTMRELARIINKRNQS